MADPASNIVGREHELEAIARFLDDVPSAPSALLIEGAAGIGKTTLWKAAVDRAEALGFVVLVTRAGQSEAKLSFTALGDLLDPIVDEALPHLPDPQRVALEVALLRVGSDAPRVDPRAVSVAALAVIRSAAAPNPVLLSVDDVQWMDASSYRVLEFCIRRLRDEPVGLLGSLRLGDHGPTPSSLDGAFPGGHVQHLSVGPIPADELGRVLRGRLGADLPHPLVQRVHSTAAGNPFYAIEIAREVLRRGAPTTGEALPVPDDLADLLRSRVGALPKVTRDALLVVASTPHPTEPLVRSASALGDRTPSALAKAESAGVIVLGQDSIRFSHPLLSSTVYTSATTEERHRVHRRLASSVEDPEERARHLAIASVGPDAQAASALDDAARDARVRGAPDSAAELSELARKLTPPEDGAAAMRRSVEAAVYHFDAGDAPRSWTLLEEAIGMAPPGPDRARVLFQLAAISWMDVRRIEELCERALREAGDDRELRTMLHENMAWVGIYRGDLALATEHARASLAHASHVGDPAIRADTYSTLGMVEFLTGRPAEGSMTEALRLQDLAPLGGSEVQSTGYTSARTCYGLQLLWEGELDGARDVLQQQLTQFERRGLYLVREEVLSYLAEVEARAGHLDTAARHALEAHEIGVESGHLSGVDHYLFPLALVEALRGDAERARSAAEEGLATAIRNDDPFYASELRWVLGFVDLSLSNPSAALEQLEPVLGFLRRMDSPEPGVIPCAPDAIEALVAVGRLDAAEAILATLEANGVQQERPWALATAGRCRGLLLAARGDLAGALEALVDSLREHERVPQPFELGRTLLLKGEVERRAKQKRAAKRSLERALTIFEELGARLWADKARAALERVGGLAGGRSELTPTERRVAELVVQGKTNREVADSLFISVKTVEANLSRVFHKLGVGSRAQLVRHVLAAGAEGVGGGPEAERAEGEA